MAKNINKIEQDTLENLKYHDELGKVSDIIMEKCEFRAGSGYRIVDNPAVPSNFKPSFVSYNENDIASYRYSAPKEEVDKLDDAERWKYATRLGVSLFTSFDKANKHANRYAKKLKKSTGEEEADAYKSKHAWIVKVDHDEDAGIVSKVHSQTGHYNLFPFKDVDLLELIDESFGYKEVIYEDDKK